MLGVKHLPPESPTPSLLQELPSSGKEHAGQGFSLLSAGCGHRLSYLGSRPASQC